MTPSEKLTADLCRRSFLSLWSYANPLKRDGRELCDALVVLGGDIVIFSVKDIALSDTADPETAEQRWTRAAIDKSVAQLRGARRELGFMKRVVRSDGSDGVVLPNVDARRVHLVAVAIGAGRKLAVQSGQWEAGGDYVHVLDERSLELVLGELDTTADFIDYLRAKENFTGMIVTTGEEDLLGAYLLGGRRMPELVDGNTVLMVEEGIWAHVQVDPDMQARRDLEKFSYWWDEFI